MKQPTKRVTRLVTRHLRLLAKGKAMFEKASLALQNARYWGLEVEQPIEIEIVDEAAGTVTKRPFVLIDNLLEMETKGAIYRPARFPRYEIKKMPKTPRKPKPEEETAA